MIQTMNQILKCDNVCSNLTYLNFQVLKEVVTLVILIIIHVAKCKT